MQLINSYEDAVRSIENLNKHLESHPSLADRLSLAHAYYVVGHDGPSPMFGFSKFVGYKDLSPADYLENYRNLDGRDTELALEPFFEQLNSDSGEYARLHEKLAEFLWRFGKRPRGGNKHQVRIMIPSAPHIATSHGEDRRLLELIFAVSEMLPATQRHELRARL